jgi:long-chain fatty acid transport protein
MSSFATCRIIDKKPIKRYVQINNSGENMKKSGNRILSGTGYLIYILLITSALSAGSVDYTSNQSAKYEVTFTRNATTDFSADIASFNPAGTAFLPQGLYFDISNQTLFMPYRESYTVQATSRDEDAEQNKPSPVLPNIYAVYSLGQSGPGKLAAFAFMGVVAGGGSLDWKDGSLGSYIAAQSVGTIAGVGSVKSHSLQASSAYVHATIGAAYTVFNDILSASLSGRSIYAMKSLKINAEYNTDNLTCEYDYNALGYSPVIGINIRPVTGLSIAMRYEFETNLKFEYKEKKLVDSNGTVKSSANTFLASVKIQDGEKFNYNLPAMLAMGVEYSLTPELKLMMDVNLYFLSQADMGKVYSNGNAVADLNEYFGTGYEITFGATYMILSDLRIGAGINYGVSGAKDKYFKDANTVLVCSANPPLDSIAFAIGGTYMLQENVDLTLACTWTHFIPYKAEMNAGTGFDNVTVDYEKNIYVIAIGAGYKM